MTILAYFVLAFALLRLSVALVNLATRNWLRPANLKNDKLVSVLIPARNEQASLPVLLNSLLFQTHKNIEVIIYDDDSTDDTAGVIQSFCQKDQRFHYLKGTALPPGWLGKNHACDRLARAAKGDYLLFLDADVETGPEMITQALAYLEKYDLSLLSIFPEQRMETFGEKITVPVMNWILVSLLPMVLIRKSPLKAFAAANGQFMLFKAADYRKNWFHKIMKTERVEDILICRLMKGRGYHVHTLLGNRHIKCRMYQNYGESIQGFSKNVVSYFGGSNVIAVLFVLLTTFGWITFLLAEKFEMLIYYLLTVVFTRILVSISSRQNIINNILFLPLQQLSLVLMVVLSIKNQLTGGFVWKNRPV